MTQCLGRYQWHLCASLVPPRERQFYKVYEQYLWSALDILHRETPEAACENGRLLLLLTKAQFHRDVWDLHWMNRIEDTGTGFPRSLYRAGRTSDAMTIICFSFVRRRMRWRQDKGLDIISRHIFPICEAVKSLPLITLSLRWAFQLLLSTCETRPPPPSMPQAGAFMHPTWAAGVLAATARAPSSPTSLAPGWFACIDRK